MKIITSEIKEQIFALYWNCQAIHKNGSKPYSSQVILIENNRFSDQDLKYGTQNIDSYIDYYNLQVTPLSSVTENDAIAVTKLLYPGNDNCTIIKNSGNGVFLMDVDSSSSLDESLEVELDFNKLIDTNWGSNIITTSYGGWAINLAIIMVFQYLISKGYAFPYLNYTVKELVELGVYELVNTGKE